MKLATKLGLSQELILEGLTYGIESEFERLLIAASPTSLERWLEITEAIEVSHCRTTSSASGMELGYPARRRPSTSWQEGQGFRPRNWREKERSSRGPPSANEEPNREPCHRSGSRGTRAIEEDSLTLEKRCEMDNMVHQDIVTKINPDTDWVYPMRVQVTKRGSGIYAAVEGPPHELFKTAARKLQLIHQQQLQQEAQVAARSCPRRPPAGHRGPAPQSTVRRSSSVTPPVAPSSSVLGPHLAASPPPQSAIRLPPRCSWTPGIVAPASPHRLVTAARPYLRLKKTPAKFIPRSLTNEQKLCRLATCEDMLEMTRTDPEWKDKIITGDETWVYGYDPETKRQSAEWRGQDIAPNDFFLFPKLKAVLKGRHFDTREDIIEKSLLALKSIPKEAYKNCFDNWEKRWRWKCLESTNLLGARWGEVYHPTNKIKFGRELQFRGFSAAEAPNHSTTRPWRRMAENSFFSPGEECNPPPCQPLLPRTLRRCGGGATTLTLQDGGEEAAAHLPPAAAAGGPGEDGESQDETPATGQNGLGGSEELPPATNCRTPWARPSVHGAALLASHPARRPVQLRPRTSPHRQVSAAVRHPPPAPLSVDS
ncbi:hypothetical protein LAZ67_10000786 [Cordylochernes scorpioides]|uniref:Uncharacterized protein n=1 Tax=Cordylochernes scorpioides TaxID=51811 RepID=A0ABY6KZ18_9ARAC|nr:hypothetical protein LAZ67_10000786 [Cordylochernes scorpioides]